MGQRTKHTIDIEIEWDVDQSWAPHRARYNDGKGHWYFTTEDLASLGVTKPEPPFKVGDIVRTRVGSYWAVEGVEPDRVFIAGGNSLSVEGLTLVARKGEVYR